MSLMNPAQWLIDFFRGMDASGSPKITEQSASTYPPAWFALNKIASDVAKLPLNPMRYLDRGAEVDDSHQAYYVCRKRPNPNQTPFSFKETLIGHALMYGNGRAAIVRGGGRINELLLMNPKNTVTVLIDGDKWHISKPMANDRTWLYFDESPDAEDYVFIPDRDVLHIPAFSYNGIEGLGLMDIGRDVFNIGINAQRTTATQILKGFNGKLMLEAPVGAFPTVEQAQEFINAFNEAHSKPENAGKAGLLRNGIKASVMNMSNKDAEFLETKQFTRQDIAMMFGLESIMGDTTQSSYASLEQKNLAYLQNCLMRWLVKIEEDCNEKLLTERQKNADSHCFKFNTAALLRGDMASTTASLVSLVGSLIINPNEAREKLDMNPYEGGDQFKNPSTTSPDRMGSDSSGDNSNDNDADEEAAVDNRIPATAVQRFLGMLKTEKQRVASCCKKPNFVASIDKFYAGWKDRLAEVALEFGSDATATDRYCDQSKQLLLDASGNATEETLASVVECEMATWSERINKLAGDICYVQA